MHLCSQPPADTLAACGCVPLPFPSTGSPPISFAQTPPRQPPHPTAPRPNSVWSPRPGLFLRRLLLQQFASSFVCPTLGITCSGLQRRRLLCPLLTSDGASPHLSMPVAQRHTVRSPRVLRTHLHAYARRIYVVVFRTRIGLHGLLPAHPTTPPLSACLAVAPALCLQLPSDSQSPRTPLPSANTSPCRLCRGLAPPSRCALPDAQKKRAPDGARSYCKLRNPGSRPGPEPQATARRPRSLRSAKRRSGNPTVSWAARRSLRRSLRRCSVSIGMRRPCTAGE